MNQLNSNNLAKLQNFVLDNQKCIIKFSAEWCMPCKTLGMTLQNESIVQLLNSNNIKILTFHMVKPNTSDDLNVLRHYDIKALPTMLFFNAQSISLKLTGAVGLEELTKQITHFINQ